MGLTPITDRLFAGVVLTQTLCFACAAPTKIGAAQESAEQEESTQSAGLIPVSAEARCEGPRDFQLQLLWRIEDPALRSRDQILDFSLLRQDFDSPGHLEVAVGPGRTTHTLRARLFDETVYYWRIRLPATGDVPQVVSEVATFTTSGCPGVDSPDG